MPELIRYYLGEEPILANVPTYLLWDQEQRVDVLERLDELVVKPVAESGGYGMLIGPTATAAELEAVRERIEADPRGYIAQEVVPLSRHPTWSTTSSRAATSTCDPSCSRRPGRVSPAGSPAWRCGRGASW